MVFQSGAPHQFSATVITKSTRTPQLLILQDHCTQAKSLRYCDVNIYIKR